MTTPNMPNGSAVALVSGGNRGIGLAITRGLAARGFTVLMGTRDLAAEPPRRRPWPETCARRDST